MLRFSQLTVQQITDFNALAMGQLKAEIIVETVSELAAKMGIREAEKDEPAMFAFKGKRYVIETSRTNRQIDIKHVITLANMMKAGRWAYNGEPLIWDTNGQSASAQHRGTAAFLLSLDPIFANVKLCYVNVTGVPPELVDTIDTNRARTQKDIFGRDPDVLSLDELTNLSGESFGDDTSAVRKTQIADLTSATRLILLRAKGKNIKAGGTMSQANLNLAHSLFGDDNGNQLEALTSLVYRQDIGLGSKSTWGSLLGRQNVVALLTLFANQDQSSPWEFDGANLTIPETMPIVDLDFATKFTMELSKAMMDPEAMLAPFIRELEKAKGYSTKADGSKTKSTKRALDKAYQFAAIANAIEHVSSGVAPSNYVPKDGSIKTEYPAFGGLDQGYVSTRKAKDDSDE